MDRPRQRAVQVHRRRHHVAAAHDRSADIRGRTRAHRHHRRPQRSYASLCGRGRRAQRRHLPIRRRRRDVAKNQHRQSCRRPSCRRGRHPRGPAQPRHRLRADDRGVEVHGWRDDLHRVARRAGRRRLSAHVDPPHTARDHSDDRRSRRHRHVEWRTDVEFLVQPAHGAVLPCEHGQRLPLPCVRRTAGIGIRLCAEPRRRRADHVSRVASGRRGGIRLRRA